MTDSPSKPEAARDGEPDMAPHLQQTIQAIARIHADHHRAATPLQHLVDRMTSIVARPAFIGVVTAVVIVWIGLNLLLARFAGLRVEPRGFPYIQGAGELAAIYITALVLMSQRRKDELSELREQLSLELAILTDQKVAKLIALNEETRRDNPQLANRVDSQAEAMAQAIDPEAVLTALKETHEDMMAEALSDQGDSDSAMA